VFDLSERYALITGAATGIGQAIAVKLAEAGATVAITDKPEISLIETEELIKPYAERLLKLAVDVRDVDQIQKGVETVEKEFGRIDILISNAGINHPTPGLEVDLENWEDHLNTNLRGGFFCAQAVAKGMQERKFGRVIFVSSQSGLVGIQGQIVYCSTKGGIVNMVRSMGVEWARFGITVNSIAPTFIETNLTRERLKNPEFLSFVQGKIPKGELSVPDDVAYAAVFLASDEAGMINCVNLPVDGGWTAW